jgi:Tfp pilus assembly protein PilV
MKESRKREKKAMAWRNLAMASTKAKNQQWQSGKSERKYQYNGVKAASNNEKRKWLKAGVIQYQ